MKPLLKFFKQRYRAYSDILGLLLGYPIMLASVVFVSFMASVVEGLGIGLLIPLLETTGDGSSLSQLPILGYISNLISDMPLIDRVRFVAIALVVLAFVRGIFLYSSRLLSFLLQIKIDRSLKSQVFQQLLDVEISFIFKEKIGNLFTILSSFTRQAGSLIQLVTKSFVSVFNIFVYGVLMLLVSWQLTFIAVILLLGINMIIKKRFSQRISNAGKAVNKANVDLNSVGFESLSAIQQIHLFVQEERTRTRFKDTLHVYQGQMYRQCKLLSIIDPLYSTLAALTLSVILISSTFFLPNQVGSWIGIMVLFLIIMYRLMAPAAGLNSVRAKVTSLYPALDSVLSFINRQEKSYLKDGPMQFEQIEQGLSFDNVSFSYNSNELSVLRDVSFEIPEGKTTAVVGPSGAGKSTLVNLIARLYDCTTGKIEIDGIGIQEFKIDSWRSVVAVVSQDTFIFNDSVLANIKFANESADFNEVQSAAQLANAHDFIMALPEGYHTILGDRGVRLSGGQQQRMAIARAILSDPQLLILDEATSSLDSKAERQIQLAIEQLSRDRTVILIAHRLSTVRKADNIVVFDHGSLVEQGTHDTLIEQSGLYAQLVQAQTLQHVGNQ